MAGRGGTCELMIGAVGKALDDALHQDFEEMEDVRYHPGILTSDIL